MIFKSESLNFKKKNLKICFLSFWLHGVFVVCGLLSPVAAPAGLPCAVHGLQSTLAQQLRPGLSSYGAQAELPRQMWDLSSLAGDRTRVPHTGQWVLHH